MGSQLPMLEGALTYRTIQFSKSTGETPEIKSHTGGQKTREPNLNLKLGLSELCFERDEF